MTRGRNILRFVHRARRGTRINPHVFIVRILVSLEYAISTVVRQTQQTIFDLGDFSITRALSVDNDAPAQNERYRMVFRSGSVHDGKIDDLSTEFP